MGKLILSASIGLATGLISFFISVAFLCIVLLAASGVMHQQQDMTRVLKVAAPVALMAAVTGFIVTLVRSFRTRPAR
jgi:hypothetical protein